MASPFADVSDLEARWRSLTPSEQTLATTLLADASAQVRAECPDVDERIADGSLDPDIPRRVVCAMVKRAMLAPADQAPLAQMQQTAGPFSLSGTFVNPTGDLYLTKAERRLLGCSRVRASSVQMGPVPCEPGPPWWVTTP